jgi:tetratricopeptide (TPR) repeat protein
MLIRLLLAVAFCQLALLCSPQHAFASEESSIRMMRATAIENSAHGRVEDALNSFDTAIHLAEQAYGRDSTYVADICFDAGLAALKADQYKKAEQCLSRAVQLNPNSVEARLKLAELYKKRGMMQDAKQQLSRVIQRHPDNLEAREILALTYQQEGNFLQANKECFALSQMAQAKEAAGARLVFAPPTPAMPPPVAPTAVAAPPVVVPAAISALRGGKAAAAQKAAADAAAKKAAEAAARRNSELAARKANDAAAKRAADAAAKRMIAEAKKNKGKKGKGKKGGGATAVADSGPASSWGLPARLKSTAVLLTPVKGKGKTASSESIAPKAEPKKEEPAPVIEATKPIKKPSVAADDEASGADEEGFGGSSTAKPKPKAAEAPPPPKPKPVAVKIEAPKRSRGGLVPPPPPVVPQFQPMVVPPPPQALAPAPKPKPKPVVESKPADSKPASRGSEDESDFLLDWAGKKKAK